MSPPAEWRLIAEIRIQSFHIESLITMDRGFNHFKAQENEQHTH